MSFTKKLIASSVAAATVAAASFAPVANAEVSASVGIANMYLWRGFNLGANGGSDNNSDSFGTPAVYGDLMYASEGFYTGVWASSGDAVAGTEFDLIAGYGGEAGDFSYDVSVVNYVYPTGPGYTDGETDFGDLTDLILSVGFGPVSLTHYNNVAGFSGYSYTTLGASFADYGVTIGSHDYAEGDSQIHVDFSYAYNDNLGFTLSQFVDGEPEGDDLKVVVSYSLPIE